MNVEKDSNSLAQQAYLAETQYRQIDIQKSPLATRIGYRSAWRVGAPEIPHTISGSPSKWVAQGAGGTLNQALAWLGKPLLSGKIAQTVGLCMSDLPDVAALDLDDCLNDGGGVVDPVALWIWALWPSYTEITLSGRGLRMWWLVNPEGRPETVVTLNVTYDTCAFDFATREMRPKSFTFGRKLYYRTPIFLVHTGNAYSWTAQGSVDPLATITHENVKLIAAAIAKRLPVLPIHFDRMYAEMR